MNLKGKRIAVYARFSSDRQRETSIEDQVRRCREYLEKEGGTFDAEHVFADFATSGASLARAGFESMMSLVTRKPPALDCIVTEDVSRVTRDLADGAVLFKKLQYLGIQLIGVGDGIDTSAKNAKVAYTVKSLVADLYLDDLRDKTLRGMEGRALAGLSTGGVPYGYRSAPVTDDLGRVTGHRLEIFPERAEIVRSIFDAYLDGMSLANIAKDLNVRGVEAPRARSRHRFVGWVDSTIRAMLHNEKYAGVWRFKTRQWVKVPDSNKRRPRARPAAEVIEQRREDLRIVTEETWQAVSARLAAVHTFYTRTADGRPKGRAVPSGKTAYPFSSLLVCGVCSHAMVIYGGSASRYYRCSHNLKRGTCDNRLGVREDVARPKLMEAIHETIASPEAISYARRKVAERLADVSRTQNKALGEHRQRLARTTARIQGLVEFIATGDRSEAVVSALHDLEAQARAEKAAIAEIERQAAEPLRLPSPDEILQRVYDLERRLRHDPVRARETLRTVLKDGHIVLKPGPDGVYLAKIEILPLAIMLELQGSRNTNAPGGHPGASVYGWGSGG